MTTRCSIVQCDSVILARGWCSRHYQRWLKHGDPTVCRWSRDDTYPKTYIANPGYAAIHRRLKVQLGSASEWFCLSCDQVPAKDWALSPASESITVARSGSRYMRVSTDPHSYVPLCRRCHARQDAAWRHIEEYA